MIAFLSGPMFDGPDHNKPAFDAAEKQLVDLGHTVLNPTRNIDRPGRNGYMRSALHDLLEADAIVLLDGWRTSRGALLERRIADELGMRSIELGALG